MDAVAQIGRPAPDFELSDLNGNTLRLSVARGRIVVVNFWSADCHHSSRADETIRRLRNQWGDEVQVLSIASNANETTQELRAAAAQRAVPVVLHDTNQSVASDYGVVTTPQVFVIDGDGILRYSGAFDDVSLRRREPTTNYLEQAVSSLLAGRAPEPAQAPPFGCALVWAAKRTGTSHPSRAS
jgi:peroxiredoxin